MYIYIYIHIYVYIHIYIYTYDLLRKPMNNGSCLRVFAYAKLTPTFRVKRNCESKFFFLLTHALRQPSESSAIAKRKLPWSFREPSESSATVQNLKKHLLTPTLRQPSEWSAVVKSELPHSFRKPSESSAIASLQKTHVCLRSKRFNNSGGT